MAAYAQIQHFEVRNEDVILRFTCPNFGKRIRECVDNLEANEGKPETLVRKQAFYGCHSDQPVEFRLGHSFTTPDDGWVAEDETEGWDAFFFENTDYPLHANAKEGIELLNLQIGKEQKEQVVAQDNILFGSINYHNQVGRTDICVNYRKDGIDKQLWFSTEVLSYKMDYRTDMRNVIRDIEEEYAMLSYSFLKETYLTFRTSDNESTDLIWWQIFRDCFSKIYIAAETIISNPKRRLQTSVCYERAERMPYIPTELENEYEEFKKNPAHLYRIEDMYLSKDTIENRFLKYALKSMENRFRRVHQNVLAIIKADNQAVRQQIEDMSDRLQSLTLHPFFRTIGEFRGFSQDSLVMKQATGYRDIYENWIILQCGYDLQEGIMQLEVKDISELYEIWCFIKIKNIVEHILRCKATPYAERGAITGNFIKTLIQGHKSEVTFFATDKPEVQLASVMYNAATDDEETLTDESDTSENTDILETTSKTTEQRPDIVLRLSKPEDKIQYTYLFDAKYRIRDTSIPARNGVEVPPVDAINQVHRYRDAIYYTKSSDNQLKREVIGGYVLYPGNLTKKEFEGSYYHRSVEQVNIGAFPFKPGSQWQKQTDDVLLNPISSEDVLYQQIKTWLEAPGYNQIKDSIPQKGLKYVSEI